MIGKLSMYCEQAWTFECCHEVIISKQSADTLEGVGDTLRRVCNCIRDTGDSPRTVAG